PMRVGQVDAFVVDVDVAAGDDGDRHGYSSGCLPVMDMRAGSGIGRPGSRTFQYIQRNPSLPQWLMAVSLSTLNGPTRGAGSGRAARVRRGLLGGSRVEGRALTRAVPPGRTAAARWMRSVPVVRLRRRW